MAKTIYTHKDCGGSVVGELRGFRLVTPFIGIGYSKLSVGSFQFLTEEFKTPKGESEGHLCYVCMKCKKEIPVEKIATEVLAKCVICKNEFPVGKLFTTDYSPINCQHCLDEAKGENAEDFRKMLDLPNRVRRSSLAEVLQQTLKI